MSAETRSKGKLGYPEYARFPDDGRRHEVIDGEHVVNPAPDMDINSLTPFYFDWVVQHMADLVVDLAQNPRPQITELRWNSLFS